MGFDWKIKDDGDRNGGEEQFYLPILLRFNLLSKCSDERTNALRTD